MTRIGIQTGMFSVQCGGTAWYPVITLTLKLQPGNFPNALTDRAGCNPHLIKYDWYYCPELPLSSSSVFCTAVCYIADGHVVNSKFSRNRQ